MVLAKNHSQGPPWIPGKIVKQSGAVTFLVELTDGTIIRRHLDQLKLHMTKETQSENELSTSSDSSDISIPDHVTSSDVATPKLRQSTRIRRPPSCFSPDNF